MKILHIIDSEGIYGAEKVVLTLMEEQRLAGHFPCLGSIGSRRASEKAIEKEALAWCFSVKKFRMWNGPTIPGALAIVKYAKKNKFDVIHTHGYKGNILLGFLPRLLRGVPIVATAHGWTSTKDFSRLWLYEWLDKRSMSRMDAVVLVSKSMIQQINTNSNSTMRYSVVNNGLADEGGKPQIPIDPSIRAFCSGGFIVGSVGRLSPEKGYSYLIEAVSILIKKGLSIKLIILGEGPERPRLQKLIFESGLEEIVMLPGYRENIREYLSLFDVFVLSSLTEGLPITLLEAMYAGKAIIATSVGGMPELLDGGSAGLIVESQDAKALSGAIARLHDDPNLTVSLRKRANTIVEQSYSSSRMAREYLDIYEKVVGSQPVA